MKKALNLCFFIEILIAFPDRSQKCVMGTIMFTKNVGRHFQRLFSMEFQFLLGISAWKLLVKVGSMITKEWFSLLLLSPPLNIGVIIYTFFSIQKIF